MLVASRKTVVQRIPHYRQLAREKNLPDEFRSLEEYVSSVPVLSKTSARSGMLLSERPLHGKWIYTGGSTVIPLALYLKRRLAWRWCAASTARARFSA